MIWALLLVAAVGAIVFFYRDIITRAWGLPPASRTEPPEPVWRAVWVCRACDLNVGSDILAVPSNCCPRCGGPGFPLGFKRRAYRDVRVDGVKMREWKDVDK